MPSYPTKPNVGQGDKRVGDKTFAALEPMEIMAIIWFFVKMLRACSFEDILFLFDAAFEAHASENTICQILSVMVGANLLSREGPINLIRLTNYDPPLVEPSKAFEARSTELALLLTDLIEERADPNYLEAMAHVG